MKEMQWEKSQCCSSFQGGDAETIQSCGTEKLRRQSIVVRMHCSRSALQCANRRRKEKRKRMVLELLLPKPVGHVLPPDFGQSWRWAVMKMGLEDTTHDVLLSGLVPQFGSRRAPELASCHLLG